MTSFQNPEALGRGFLKGRCLQTNTGGYPHNIIFLEDVTLLGEFQFNTTMRKESNAYPSIICGEGLTSDISALTFLIPAYLSSHLIVTPPFILYPPLPPNPPCSLTSLCLCKCWSFNPEYLPTAIDLCPS